MPCDLFQAKDSHDPTLSSMFDIVNFRTLMLIRVGPDINVQCHGLVSFESKVLASSLPACLCIPGLGQIVRSWPGEGVHQSGR